MRDFRDIFGFVIRLHGREQPPSRFADHDPAISGETEGGKGLCQPLARFVRANALLAHRPTSWTMKADQRWPMSDL